MTPERQATQCTRPLLLAFAPSLLLLSLLLVRLNSAPATDTEGKGDTDDDRGADFSPFRLAPDTVESMTLADASHTLQYTSDISYLSTTSSGIVFQVEFGSLLCLLGLAAGEGEELLDVLNPLEDSESTGHLVAGKGAGNGSLCVV